MRSEGEPVRPGILGAVPSLALGSVFLVAGATFGRHEVSGHYDSESFDYGSPFHPDHDGGYRGGEQFSTCEQEGS